MKKTTKKISAAALALVMGATAFTGCSGSTAAVQQAALILLQRAQQLQAARR